MWGRSIVTNQRTNGPFTKKKFIQHFGVSAGRLCHYIWKLMSYLMAAQVDCHWKKKSPIFMDDLKWIYWRKARQSIQCSSTIEREVCPLSLSLSLSFSLFYSYMCALSLSLSLSFLNRSPFLSSRIDLSTSMVDTDFYSASIDGRRQRRCPRLSGREISLKLEILTSWVWTQAESTSCYA